MTCFAPGNIVAVFLDSDNDNAIDRQHCNRVIKQLTSVRSGKMLIYLDCLWRYIDYWNVRYL